jgi:hypothetical protein
MAEYRLYTLDERGRIGLARQILADGDQQALAKVSEMNLNFRKCEVWDGHRMVAALDAATMDGGALDVAALDAAAIAQAASGAGSPAA